MGKTTISVHQDKLGHRVVVTAGEVLIRWEKNDGSYCAVHRRLGRFVRRFSDGTFSQNYETR